MNVVHAHVFIGRGVLVNEGNATITFCTDGMRNVSSSIVSMAIKTSYDTCMTTKNNLMIVINYRA